MCVLQDIMATMNSDDIFTSLIKDHGLLQLSRVTKNAYEIALCLEEDDEIVKHWTTTYLENHPVDDPTDFIRAFEQEPDRIDPILPHLATTAIPALYRQGRPKLLAAILKNTPKTASSWACGPTYEGNPLVNGTKRVALKQDLEENIIECAKMLIMYRIVPAGIDPNAMAATQARDAGMNKLAYFWENVKFSWYDYSVKMPSSD